MLRIGELATLAGVTTRTIRHYHRLGLLAEPPRTSGGYRLYGMTDVVTLIRARRLAALGMPLVEVARVLGRPGDLRTALADLDADLARQEEAVRAQRALVAGLLDGGHDPALTPDLAQVFTELERVLPADPLLDREREAVTVIQAAAPEAAAALAGLYREALADEETVARLWALGRRFSALGDASPDAPGVTELAGEFREALGPLLAAGLAGGGGPSGELTAALMLDGLSPAQRRVVELIGYG